MDNDGPEFVSPPFPVIFLTVAKVIVSAILILGGIGIVGVIVVGAVLLAAN